MVLLTCGLQLINTPPRGGQWRELLKEARVHKITFCVQMLFTYRTTTKLRFFAMFNVRGVHPPGLGWFHGIRLRYIFQTSCSGVGHWMWQQTDRKHIGAHEVPVTGRSAANCNCRIQCILPLSHVGVLEQNSFQINLQLLCTKTLTRVKPSQIQPIHLHNSKWALCPLAMIISFNWL